MATISACCYANTSIVLIQAKKTAFRPSHEKVLDDLHVFVRIANVRVPFHPGFSLKVD